MVVEDWKLFVVGNFNSSALQISTGGAKYDHMTVKISNATTRLIVVILSPMRRWRRREDRYEKVDAQKPWLVWGGYLLGVEALEAGGVYLRRQPEAQIRLDPR